MPSRWLWWLLSSNRCTLCETHAHTHRDAVAYIHGNAYAHGDATPRDASRTSTATPSRTPTATPSRTPTATPNVGSVVTKYYYLGGQRVAMRKDGVLYYLLSDHLGSTTVITDQSGNVVSQQLYKPYGEPRWSTGTLPTDRRFTGQRSEEAGLGSLYDYGARFYSPALGRFLSPDTIVPEPGNPQSLNRYSYTLNNPVKYRDPSGHVPAPSCAGIPDCGVDGWYGYQEYAVRKYLDAERAQGAKKFAGFVGNAVSIFFEPADYAMTLGGCASGDCSVPGLIGMAIPGVSGAIGKHVGEQVVKHADEVVTAASGVTQKRIVIGEGMDAIKTAARNHEAKWYQAWSKNFEKENFDLAQSLSRDERWIRDKVKQGYEVLSIGLDPLRSMRSEFYALEMRILKELKYPVTPIERPFP